MRVLCAMCCGSTLRRAPLGSNLNFGSKVEPLFCTATLPSVKPPRKLGDLQRARILSRCEERARASSWEGRHYIILASAIEFHTDRLSTSGIACSPSNSQIFGVKEKRAFSLGPVRYCSIVVVVVAAAHSGRDACRSRGVII